MNGQEAADHRAAVAVVPAHFSIRLKTCCGILFILPCKIDGSDHGVGQITGGGKNPSYHLPVRKVTPMIKGGEGKTFVSE